MICKPAPYKLCLTCILVILIGLLAGCGDSHRKKDNNNICDDLIKAYCIDFNWGPGGAHGFAKPGLAHDFLSEMVKLGRENGMKVFGYFCAGANPSLMLK
jgi:hypothetical protein